MTDPNSEKPARRLRYRGTHPRQFHEKYKEQQPERYPGDVAKVLKSGKTPAGMHRPVMVREVFQVLALKPGDVAVDCTLGYGGHAREILRVVQPDGKLFGFDLDPIELPKTEARLRGIAVVPESLRVWRRNFAGIAQVLAAESPGGVDAIFADLGVSSMQIDDPSRGFTYKSDGPLDMRMNPTRGLSAADWLSKLKPEEFARMLRENSDEPLADELAAAILQAHDRKPLATTRELAEVVRTTSRRVSRALETDGAVQRVFQALRIAVNDEFRSLEAFLRQLPGCLKPGGRVAVLTFHSGEDRRVKSAFKQGWQAGDYSAIATEVMRASREEQHANPRSSAAKLRFAVRSPP